MTSDDRSTASAQPPGDLALRGGVLSGMTDAEVHAIRRENEYLKLRNAQLQADLAELSAEASRLRQSLERHTIHETGQ